MSFAYTIDPTKRLVSVKFASKLTVHDIKTYAASLRGHPLFEPSFSEIVDLCQVEELELGAEQALNLADQVDPFSPGSKRAFVAQSPALVNAARMHALLREDNENFRICASLEDAELWIER